MEEILYRSFSRANDCLLWSRTMMIFHADLVYYNYASVAKPTERYISMLVFSDINDVSFVFTYIGAG